MTCIVCARSREIPIDVWTRIHDNQDPRQLIEYTLSDLMEKIEYSVLKSYGFFMKIHTEIFVITSSKIINASCIELSAFVTNILGKFVKIDLKIVKIIQDFNIAILKSDIFDIEKHFKYYDKDNILYDLSEIRIDNTNLLTCNRTGDARTKLKKIKIHNDYHKSLLIPQLPIIKYSCDIFHMNMANDFAGALVESDNKQIISMTMSDDDDEFESIPISVIYELALSQLVCDDDHVPYFHINASVMDVQHDDEYLTCLQINSSDNSVKVKPFQ